MSLISRRYNWLKSSLKSHFTLSLFGTDAFWDFCQKCDWKKISNFGEYVRNQKRSKHDCYLNFEKWHKKCAFIFSDFLFVGTKNWDFSQILFGEKFTEPAILWMVNMWNFFFKHYMLLNIDRLEKILFRIFPIISISQKYLIIFFIHWKK